MKNDKITKILMRLSFFILFIGAAATAAYEYVLLSKHKHEETQSTTDSHF